MASAPYRFVQPEFCIPATNPVHLPILNYTGSILGCFRQWNVVIPVQIVFFLFFFFINIHLFLVDELTGIAVLGLQVDTLLIFSFSKSPTPQPIVTSFSSVSYYSTSSSLPAHAKALYLHFSCFVSLSCWFVFLSCLVFHLFLLSLLFF